MTVTRREGKVGIPFLFVSLLLTLLLLAGSSFAAERPSKAKKAAPAPQREGSINDSNVQDYLKRAEDLLKKGDVDGALPTLLKVNDYSEDVLKTVKYFQGQYEKAANDSSLSQGEREDITIKLKRMAQLVPKYTNLKEVSAYYLGYAYTRKGDQERARKYLIRVLESAHFSVKQDSLWMKSKRLLLQLYNLEGEF